jgi:Transglycosylase-like domain
MDSPDRTRARRLAIALAVGLLLAVAAAIATAPDAPAARGPSGAVAAAGPPTSNRSQLGRCPDFRRGLVFYRRAISTWRFRLGAPPAAPTTPEVARRRPGTSRCRVVRRRAVAARERSARLRAAFESWYAKAYERWRCIHRLEGSWTANTGNGYYGGLQMDLAFQRAYGWRYLRRWGTADSWPPWAQLRTAENARRSRGYWPWPNTARACGLL